MTGVAAIAARLDAERVPYALIGAAAMAAHGVSRSTFDIDLLTTDPRVLAAEFWESLSGVTADVRRGAADDPLAGVVRFRAVGERDVDLIVGRDGWQREILARAVGVEIGGAAVPVAAAADLVLLKLYAGGSQDAWDIEQLLAAAGDRAALVRDVEARLPALPSDCRVLWDRVSG